jgi:hypothetical protein
MRRVREWLDEVVGEVFVDDGGVDIGDLRSFGESVDHERGEGVGDGDGDVEQEAVAAGDDEDADGFG